MNRACLSDATLETAIRYSDDSGSAPCRWNASRCITSGAGRGGFGGRWAQASNARSCMTSTKEATVHLHALDAVGPVPRIDAAASMTSPRHRGRLQIRLPQSTSVGDPEVLAGCGCDKARHGRALGERCAGSMAGRSFSSLVPEVGHCSKTRRSPGKRDLARIARLFNPLRSPGPLRHPLYETIRTGLARVGIRHELRQPPSYGEHSKAR